MAAAVLVPNVEFIFGLTGATASVLISYILPALTFIRLLDTSHELTSGMHRQTKVGAEQGLVAVLQGLIHWERSGRAVQELGDEEKS